MLNRRQFLKYGLLTASGATLTYTMAKYNFFSREGISDLGKFLGNHFYRKKVPDGEVLVDSHAHFDANLPVQDLVDALFDSDVTMQVVSDLNMNFNVARYDHFRHALPSVKNIEIVMSDDLASVIRRRGKMKVLTKGREFITLYEKRKLGRDHEIHIVSEGETDFFMHHTYDLLWELERRNLPTTMAHPFSVPTKTVKFWPPNKRQIKNLDSLCKDFDMFVEGMNGSNTLWMAPTNAQSRTLARKHYLPLIYNSDLHPYPLASGVRQQLGVAGTLIPEFDFTGLNGKEIIEKKYQLIKEQGEMYGGPEDSWTFFKVMFLRKLGIFF